MDARSFHPAYDGRLDEADWSTSAHLQDLSFLCDDNDSGQGGPAPRQQPSRRDRIVDGAFARLRTLVGKPLRFFARFAPAPATIRLDIGQHRARAE
jgi:hypothetical protein